MNEVMQQAYRIVAGQRVNVTQTVPSLETIRAAFVAAKPVAVELGLLLVYENQTRTEQLEGSVREDNGVGFNGADARYATSLVESMQFGTGPDVKIGMGRSVKRLLTPKQREKAGKLLVKYARQVHTQMEKFAAK